MQPATRNACENELIDAYYLQLVTDGVDALTFTREMCEQEYVRGGLGRWMWFMGYFAGSTLPWQITQFFHD